MSLFTTELQRIFDGGTPTRIELARRTGILYATLSNYATGRSTPDNGAMQAICEVLERQDAALLAEAWLRDFASGSLEKLVRVERRESAPEVSREADEWRLPALNRQQCEAMEKLAHAVITHTEWEQLLYALTDVLPSGKKTQQQRQAANPNPSRVPTARIGRRKSRV